MGYLIVGVANIFLVLSPCFAGNVARNKPARQTGTSPMNAGKAVDGKLDIEQHGYYQKVCAHPNTGSKNTVAEWWVDLEETYEIHSVTVHNTYDISEYHLMNHFAVEVVTGYDDNIPCSVFSKRNPVPLGGNVIIDCHGARGRSLHLKKLPDYDDSGQIVICEVEVDGPLASPSSNLGPQAIQMAMCLIALFIIVIVLVAMNTIIRCKKELKERSKSKAPKHSPPNIGGGNQTYQIIVPQPPPKHLHPNIGGGNQTYETIVPQKPPKHSPPNIGSGNQTYQNIVPQKPPKHSPSNIGSGNQTYQNIVPQKPPKHLRPNIGGGNQTYETIVPQKPRKYAPPNKAEDDEEIDDVSEETPLQQPSNPRAGQAHMPLSDRLSAFKS